MGRIRLGMIGGGPGSFIGSTHRIAATMDDEYRLVGGVFSSNHDRSVSFARDLELDTARAYESVDVLIEAERALPEEVRMQAVTIATPNHLHYEAARKLIESGFHVICDKPVTMTVPEAEHLERLVSEHGVVFCLTHNYTGYPMVREARSLIEKGEIGPLQKIDVQYYMGALNPYVHDREKRRTVWRLDPEKAGMSCNAADLGTHAFNLVEYVTRIEVSELLSDLNNLYEDILLDVDASVLLRFGKNLKGVLTSSHIATGEENSLIIRVYGSRGGLVWGEENPNYLYLLRDSAPSHIFSRAKESNSRLSLDGTRVFRGLPEGFFEAFANLYRGTARAIRNEPVESGEFPTIRDGVRTMRFVEAVVKSHQNGNVWVRL
jgi:predicted dehydrogenase